MATKHQQHHDRRSRRPASTQHPRYRILETLGAGGMGTVYLAEDLVESGQRVALKTYPEGTPVELLRREFLTLRRLRHPGIARAYHFGVSQADQRPFYTLEYLEGTPLDVHFEEPWHSTPPTWCDASQQMGHAGREALNLFVQAAAAVSHLHRHQLLHLDIKPSNLMVLRGAGEGAPSVLVFIDFGLVRIEGDEQTTTRGTLPFMAPEMLHGEEPNSLCDLFALGVTFYRLFAGKMPYHGDTPTSLLRSYRRGAATTISGVPRPLANVLGRLLARHPEDRFQDANALVTALLEILGTEPTASHPFVPLPDAVDLVGRQAEIAEIQEWIESPRRSPFLCVSGKPGNGRSRILEEAEALIQVRGKVAVLIRPAVADGLNLIRESVARVAAESPPTALEISNAQHLFGPAGLVPYESADASGGAHDFASIASDTTSGDPVQLVRRQALSWLGTKTLRESLFLLIDDVDRIDPDGVSFLRQLSQWLQRPPRDMETESGSSGGMVVVDRDTKAWRGPGIEVGPLSEDAVAKWLELFGVSSLQSGAFCQRIYKTTRGVPLLLAWELRSAAQMILGEEHDQSRTRQPADPGKRVQEELRRLAPASRTLVDILALVELPPRTEQLAGAATLTLRETVREVRILESRGILYTGRDGRIRLSYAPFRDAALADTSATYRRDLHRKLGQWTPNTTAERVAQAYHLFEAGEIDEAATAAKSALGIRPIDPFRRAELTLKVLDRASKCTSLSTDDQMQIVESLADRLQESGKLREAMHSWTTLVRGMRGRSLGDRVRLRRKMAHTRYLLGETSKAEEDLMKCLASLPQKGATTDRLAIFAELAIIAHYGQASERAADWASQGIDYWKTLPRRSRDQSRQQSVYLHGILGQVWIRKLKFSRAVEVLEAGAKLGKSHRVNSSVLLNNLGLAYHLDSQLSKALKTFQKARDIVSELFDESARIAIVCNIAQIYAKLGKFREARNVLEDIQDSNVLGESERLQLSVLYTLALIDSLQEGTSAPPWNVVERTAVSVGDQFLLGFIAIYQAESAIRREDWPLARECLERARKVQTLQQESSARSLFRSLIAGRLAVVEASSGREEAARQALARAKAHRFGKNDLLGAWNRVSVGMALRELGALSDSRRQLSGALATFKSIGVVPGRVEADLCLAEIAVHQGDLRRGRHHLEQVTVTVSRSRSTGGRMRVSNIRVPLLEARLLLLDPVQPEALAERLAKVQDLLAKAEAEPGFPEFSGAVSTAECIRVALARLSASPVDLRNALQDLSACNGSSRERQPSLHATMRRCGMESYGLPAEVAFETSLREAAIDALEELLDARHALDLDLHDDAPSLLDRVVSGLEGTHAVLFDCGKSSGGKRRKPTVVAAHPNLAAVSAPPLRALKGLQQMTNVRAAKDVDQELLGTFNQLPQKKRGQSVFFGPLPLPDERQGWIIVISSRPLKETSFGDLRFFQSALNALSSIFHAARGAGRDSRESADDTPDLQTEPLEKTRLLGQAVQRTRKLTSGTLPMTASVTTDFVAESDSMKQIVETVQAIAATDLAVLITGDSGTGKDTIARLIHRLSRRASGPFVVQSIGSIPAPLFEADLFGHKRGAFTGAEKTRSGFLLQAQAGTFLLDEIGDAESAVQNKLLRILEEGALRPVGGQKSVELDIRFIASSQVDVVRMVESGDFRKDLYFRLCGVHLHIPELQHREEDILPLFRIFLRRVFGFLPEIPREVEDFLLAYSWPGNVRELRSLVQRLSLSLDSNRDVIRRDDVERAIGPRSAAGPITPGMFRNHSHDEMRRFFDVAHLRHLFEIHRGDLEEMALALDTSTRSLYRRFERHGLRPKDLLRDLKKPRGRQTSR